MKGICLLVILVWHCGFLKLPDWGARCCEMFFVMSGFLEGAGHRFNWAYALDDGEVWV
jgi:peptidoglycan/LPS O-acetylase OafA/YrhL